MMETMNDKQLKGYLENCPVDSKLTKGQKMTNKVSLSSVWYSEKMEATKKRERERDLQDKIYYQQMLCAIIRGSHSQE